MPDDLNIEKKISHRHAEGTGTNFQITDSDYLNITLDSSETIKLMLESVPEMITMHIEPPSDSRTDSSSTKIIISGFEANTTYHKYEDHYYNHVEFTTDKNGNYTYTQDISESHIIFIQPRASTYYLMEEGFSSTYPVFTPAEIGTWDSTNRIATLTTDIDQSIEVLIDDVTLDGGGYTSSGAGTGIFLHNRQNVTIENVSITNQAYGMFIEGSSNNTIENVSITNLFFGIYFWGSSNNTIQNNTIYGNGDSGIVLYQSSNSTVQGNTIYNNAYNGINLPYNSNNIIQDNTIYGNNNGIVLSGSSNNTVQGNTIYENNNGICFDVYSNTNTAQYNTIYENNNGIFLEYYSNTNTVQYNTIYGNTSYGIVLEDSSNNSIINNNFINKPGQNTYDTGDNAYENNYWSDYTCDGTTPYKIPPYYINSDNYPLAAPLLIDTIMLLKIRTDNINNKLDDSTSGLDAINNNVNNIDSKVDNIQNELDDPTSGLDAINNNINNMDSKVDDMDSKVDDMDSKVNNMDSEVNNINHKVDIILGLLNAESNPKVLTTGPVVADENANSLVVQVLNTTGRCQNITVTVYDIKGSPTKVYTVTFTFDSKSSCTQFEIFGVPPTQYEVVFKGLEPGFYAWTSTRTQNYCASLKYSEFIKANTFRHSELIPIY